MESGRQRRNAAVSAPADQWLDGWTFEPYFCSRVPGHTERIIGRKPVSVRNLSNLHVCVLFLFAAVALNPDAAGAQNSRVCDGYARDFAQRNSAGHVGGSAARGAIGGALIGGIIGGGRGAGRSPSSRHSISANSSLGMATSASSKVM